MYLELKIPPYHTPVTDEEFLKLCRLNKGSGVSFEKNTCGVIHVFPPGEAFVSSKNAEISAEITLWNRKKKSGVVTGSNHLFRLADGSIRRCHIAWISLHRWEAFSEDEPTLCPDCMIEIPTYYEDISFKHNRMQEYLENGCRLGWLIDPTHQKAYIYRPDQEVETIESFDHILSGEEILRGFELDLKILR